MDVISHAEIWCEY